MKLASFTKPLVLPLLLMFCQCKSEKQVDPATVPAEPEVEYKKYSFTEPHLGTMVHIVLYTDEEDFALELSQKCFQRVVDCNAIFSDYRDDSELSKLCQKPINESHKVSKELFTVIAKAVNISAKTNGAFDITLGEQTQAWRKQASRQSPQPGSTNYQHLKLDPKQQTITLLRPLKIDLGGIAKGYIADQIMGILKDAGIKSAGVIIGGETVLAAAPPGKKGWRIGIENPGREIIGTLTLANTALSTSGDSYQYFEQDGERKSHLIDPTTKQSKINRLNVTTIASTAMQADAWATALRVLPTEQAITIANKEPTLEALFIPYKQNTSSTNNFPTPQLP